MLNRNVRIVDDRRVFRSRSDAADRLHQQLRALPTQFLVYMLDAAWFVVGPTGLFVVTDQGDDPSGACTRAASQAQTVRSELADELHWVPFVDAIVVGDGRKLDIGTVSDCALIPRSLLRATLCDGPKTVDDESLARLAMVGLRRVYPRGDSIAGWTTGSSDPPTA